MKCAGHMVTMRDERVPNETKKQGGMRERGIPQLLLRWEVV